jgi:hypothetical protein
VTQILRLLYITLVLTTCCEVLAASSKSAPASGVQAEVRTDGALVYTKGDFDSEVIGELRQGQQVRVSKGTTAEEPKFRRVILMTKAGKKLGFVADIDVHVLEGDAQDASASGKSKKKKSKKDGSKDSKKRDKKKKEKPHETKAIYFTRYLGVAVGMTSFKESISGVDSNENLVTYGLKISGPDILIDGPVMDFNLVMHYGAPSYYDKLSVSKPSGFVIMTDALFVLPIYQGTNSMLYLGVGPMLVFSDFKVVNSSRAMDLSQLSVGLSGAAGFAVRFDKVAFRLEGKYFLEKQTSKAVQASIQTEF